jgi:hypothetical protein
MPDNRHRRAGEPYPIELEGGFGPFRREVTLPGLVKRRPDRFSTCSTLPPARKTGDASSASGYSRSVIEIWRPSRRP